MKFLMEGGTMKLKTFVKDYFMSPFFKHFLMITNLIIFFFISFISLTFDAIFPFNYINIALVALFIVITIVYLIVSKTKPCICVFTLCYFGLIICMFLSFAVNGFVSFPRTPILISSLSLFIFLWLEQNKKHINFYIFSFLIASWCFLIVFTIVEFSSIIHPNFSNRIGSFFGNENDVARHLVFAFLISIYYIYSFKKIYLKLLTILICLFCSYLILLSGSISNLLLLIICIFAFALVVPNKRTKLFLILGFTTVIVLLGVLVFSLHSLLPIKNRILSILSVLFGVGNYRYDSSTAGRLNAAIYAFRLFFLSPLFGNGYNSVVNNYKIMAHNNLAEIAADYGIFALLLEEVVLLFPMFAKTNNNKKGKVFIKTISIYLILIQLFLIVFNSKVEAIVIPMVYIVLNKNKPLSLLVSRQGRQITEYNYFEVNV